MSLISFNLRISWKKKNKPLAHHPHFIMKCVSDIHLGHTAEEKKKNSHRKKVTQSTDKQANDALLHKSHSWRKEKELKMKRKQHGDWQLTRHSPDSADCSHSPIQCYASTSCSTVKSKQGGTMPAKLHLSIAWGMQLFTQVAWPARYLISNAPCCPCRGRAKGTDLCCV